jgi:uncharacterized protein
MLSAGLAAGLGPAAARAAASRDHQEYFEVSRTTLWVAGLADEHDGLTIAQLSDIHVGRATPAGRIIRAVRSLNALQPDVVALTGDFVTTRRDPVSDVPRLLCGFAAPVFVVLGNHDHWTYPQELAKGLEHNGFTVLQNQHTQLNVRGAPLTILGLGDTTTRNDDARATFVGAPTTGSRLVLTHTPTGADKLPPDANLVTLAGHTHGGQIHIPGLTERLFKAAGQPYVRGVYRPQRNTLFVNRGLGFGYGAGFTRIDSDPELALITLRRLEGTKAAS